MTKVIREGHSSPSDMPSKKTVAPEPLGWASPARLPNRTCGLDRIQFFTSSCRWVKYRW